MDSAVMWQFAFLDFNKSQRLLLQSAGKYYVVGALLTNLHACCSSTQTGRFIGAVTPSVRAYIAHEYVNFNILVTIVTIDRKQNPTTK